MTYHRILVATDYSDGSLAAARLSLRLGGENARYRVVHVRPARDVPQSVLPDDVGQRRELATWCERAGLPTSEQAILEGSPAREIARDAATFKADLIALGHSGKNRLERVLLGSTARSIVRLAPSDALIVRAPLEMSGVPFGNVLVATDFYAASGRAARRAKRLAERSGASLSVVYAIDPDMWTQATRKTPRDDFPAAEEWLGKTYADMLTKFNHEHLDGKAKEHLVKGSPGKAVAEQARLQGADLLVVGTHGAHGLERLLLGTHAEALVERAPCSVLVVR